MGAKRADGDVLFSFMTTMEQHVSQTVNGDTHSNLAETDIGTLNQCLEYWCHCAYSHWGEGSTWILKVAASQPCSIIIVLGSH